MNIADDYDTACKIRRYTLGVEASDYIDQAKMEWINWAKAKTDWFDPTIAKRDELLGKREHAKGLSQKKLEHAWYSW